MASHEQHSSRVKIRHSPWFCAAFLWKKSCKPPLCGGCAADPWEVARNAVTEGLSAEQSPGQLTLTAPFTQGGLIHNNQTYYLRNANSGMYLDLQASGFTNSTHFQQYPGAYASELFRIKYQPGGYYTVETTLVGASGSSMVMDGRSNCVAGAQVILYEYVIAPEQLWFISRNSNGTYTLSPKKNMSLNLAVEGGSTASNAKVKLALKNDLDPSQQWYIEKPVDVMKIWDYGEYYLRNAHSGMYLDLQRNGTTNGTHFQQYPYISSPCSERFEIIGESDGYFTVQTTLARGMVMDGRSNCVAGAQVILYQDVSGAPEQNWHLRKNSNGTFSIAPKKNVYLNLAVLDWSTASNAKVILAHRNDADPCQQWYLEPADPLAYDWSYVFSNANEYSNISSGYHLWDRPDHHAIDIIGKTTSIAGQPILAPADGKVVYKSSEFSSGNHVVIEFDDCFWPGTGRKLRAGFMHMQDPCSYYVGATIKKGTQIGRVGNSGTTAYHLDLSVFTSGNWADESNCINPQRLFPLVPFTGYTSTLP